MLKIISSTSNSIQGRVLRKKHLNKGDVIMILTSEGKRKIFKIEYLRKVKKGYIIKNSNITLVLKEK